MHRKYKEYEIKNPQQFPGGSFYCNQNCKDLNYEFPLGDESIGSYCMVVRSALPKFSTARLYAECQRDCTLQITNRIFNNVYLQPRFNCLYANPEIKSQKYSNTEVPAIPWTPYMKDLRDYVSIFGMESNAALCNGYLTKDHYVDYHSDKEVKDINNKVITVSLGGSRVFSFMRKCDNELSPPIWLHDGDIAIFWGGTNKYYKHSILKPLYETDSSPRYSITFRVI